MREPVIENVTENFSQNTEKTANLIVLMVKVKPIEIVADAS
jgi:hypothetical protein